MLVLCFFSFSHFSTQTCAKIIWLSVNAFNSFVFYILMFDIDWLSDWMVFYAAFNNISVISPQQLTLFMSFLGFTNTRLGLWGVLPKDTPTKNPEDPVWLKPRTPELWVKHLITEPSRTPVWYRQPFPKWQIVDSSKLKEFTDDNLEFHENGNMFSKAI